MSSSIQKEARSHVSTKDEDPNTIDNLTPHSVPFYKRKKAILIIIGAMVAVTALALGLGLGLGLAEARHGQRHAHKQSTTSTSSTTASPTSSTASAASPTATTESVSGTSDADVAQPAVGTTWDYPLGFSLTTSNVNASTVFYPVDLEDTSASTISSLTSAGHTIVCYFSAGSYEDWRADADQFPASALGNGLDGWEGENWLDTTDSTVRSIMAARIQSAADKGCVGVDADNIDGYENDSGFDLTEDTAVDYITFLADTAHGLGLAYGLKNGGDLVDRVIDLAEWAINEQCAEYDECDLYAPFISAGKPVFHVEYTDDDDATSVSASALAKACDASGQSGFSTVVKHESLDNWVVYC
ncbi:glycoside hydrolase superfamily [Xylariaceae sp. FL1019]|nr:glycoside hydrolase superfamily [Xylariaceae sp. FL1019]